VIVLLIITCALAIFVLAWAVFNRPRQDHYSFAIQRIDRLATEAKDQIRRRRQYAEDQLRRLSKWQ
jgi:Flp pilus assembly protein TadB